ncbi:unnamed protein product [Arctogadus glacialis]
MMTSSVRAEPLCSWLKKESTHSESMFHLWSNQSMSTLKKTLAGLGVSLPLFPQRQYDQAGHLTAGQKVVLLSETFGALLNVSVAWSSNISSSSQPRIDRLNSDLHRQKTELHQCVNLLSSSSSSSSSVTKLTKRIKVHLKALKKSLHQQDLLRSSLLAHLVRLDLLASSISP